MDKGHGWFKCPKCGDRACSFWEHQFEFNCAECREAEERLKDGKGLLAAINAGQLRLSELTDEGRACVAEYEASLK